MDNPKEGLRSGILSRQVGFPTFPEESGYHNLSEFFAGVDELEKSKV
jgi:hypothetical protein